MTPPHRHPTPPGFDPAPAAANARPRGDPTPSEHEVLRRRAEALARPLAANPLAAGALQVLRFGVGEQTCLLELEWLREVQPLRELLPLPSAPPALLGLVQWRGRLLPVLDLAALLAVAPGSASRHLLVLGRQRPALALAVATVQGLDAVAPQQVEQRAEPLEGLHPGIVRGLTREGHLFLDGARLPGLHGGGAAPPERHQPSSA